jgi:multidrug efflux pump subunit AcrA (membrane-fusion protein)
VNRSLLAVLVGVVLLIAAGCSSRAGSGKPASSPPPSVATVTAARGTIAPSLQIAGVITPFRQVGVAADLSEPIVEVDVQEGDHVHGGQVLARLLTDDLEAQLASAERVVSEDVARYSQTAYQVNAVNAQDQSAIRSAQAALHQAQVNLSGAVTDLKRYQSLFAQGYLPAQTVDEQRTTVSSDQAAVTSARAALNQAIANAHANGSGANASVEQLRRQLKRAVIVAPVSGVVDAVNANPGEYPSGRQLFTIEQVDNVYAILPSSTAQVVQVTAGATATVVASGSTRHDAGRVVAVLDQVQPGTTNFTVKVLIANADGHLHAGMPVTGTVELPPVTGVKIPMSAFVDDTHTSVYTVANGTVHTQAVSLVKDDGMNAVVLGLPAGSVVVKNVEDSDLGNGDRVTVTSK